MKNKIAKISLLLSIPFALASCANSLSGPVPSGTVTSIQTAAPQASVAAPENSENAATATPSMPDDGTIPADILAFLQSYGYEDIDEYNEYFADHISTDLNADGQKETIEIIPGEVQKDENWNTSYYSSLKIVINGQALEIKADQGWNLGFKDTSVTAMIVDIDQNDSEKELVIEEGNETEENYTGRYFVILYQKDGPKLLTKIDFYPEANGSGYINSTQYTKTLKGGYAIAIRVIQRYDPATGFTEAPSEGYQTVSYTSLTPEAALVVSTQWEQKLAASPGTEPNKTVAKGTKIYFGLYDQKGWIEVFSPQGEKLGWLDLNTVDLDKYIGNAIQASCH